MVHSFKKTALLCNALVFAVLTCFAQDVEPPFTWKGDGSASLVSQDGSTDFTFQFELSVDAQGRVSGTSSTDEGSSTIKHVFYSDKQEYDFFNYFTRKIIIVLMMNEESDTPMVSIINGRLLLDKLLYGELLLVRYEAGSEMDNVLYLNQPEMTLLEDGKLPEALQSAIDKCIPLGCAKIVGNYTHSDSQASDQEDQAAAAQKSATMPLFNGEDFNGWHMYLKNQNADPKKVWTIRDGAIHCSGKGLGFLRTEKKYRDFKLTFEWKWPGKPGNSGVLLRMDGEEKIWPLCMEAQLMHTKAGDLVGMGCDFNENVIKQKDSFIRYAPHRSDASEKVPGEWNMYEIACKDDTITLTVNGVLQNKATGVTLGEGYIGFQSEGAPIVFRNVRLTPLDSAMHEVGDTPDKKGDASATTKDSKTAYRGSYYANGKIYVNTYGTPEGKPVIVPPAAGQEDFKPSWSKTGDMLVFFRRVKNDPNVVNWKTVLCVIKTDGTGFQALTDDKQTNFNPTWTRDGTNRPIWNRKNPDTGSFFVCWSEVGNKPGQEEAVSDKRYHTWVHTCLTDGRILVESMHPKLGWGYFLMTPKPGGTSKFERIDCAGMDRLGLLCRISLSPSEKKICFGHLMGHKFRETAHAICIADFDVKKRTISNVKVIANNERKEHWYAYPRWTKDASAVVYHANSTGKGALFLYNLKNGTTQRVSTDPNVDYRYPHGEAAPK